MRKRSIMSRVASIFIASLVMVSALSFAAHATGTEDVITLTYNGVEYGKITLSGLLNSGKKEFNILGETNNWSYAEVSQNSTCTITPADFDGFLYIYLESYLPSNGAYIFNDRDDWAFTQLLADGRSSVGWGSWAYSGEGSYSTYIPSSEHPASFVFGRNTGITPVYEDTYDYTLYPDGTLYVLRTEVYNSANEFICCSSQPYFVKGSSMGETVPTVTAKPTSSTVFINGPSVAFDAYTIEGNNYFKLRDLAKVLTGTEKQFEVTWDGAKNAINLVSGKAYTPVGGEMAKGDGTAKDAQANKSAIYLNGESVSLTAYTIGGNNYFKLRDIGKLFDFDVSWDGANNAIIVETAAHYTDD